MASGSCGLTGSQRFKGPRGHRSHQGTGPRPPAGGTHGEGQVETKGQETLECPRGPLHGLLGGLPPSGGCWLSPLHNCNSACHCPPLQGASEPTLLTPGLRSQLPTGPQEVPPGSQTGRPGSGATSEPGRAAGGCRGDGPQGPYAQSRLPPLPPSAPAGLWEKPVS